MVPLSPFAPRPSDDGLLKLRRLVSGKMYIAQQGQGRFFAMSLQEAWHGSRYDSYLEPEASVWRQRGKCQTLTAW